MIGKAASMATQSVKNIRCACCLPHLSSFRVTRVRMVISHLLVEVFPLLHDHKVFKNTRLRKAHKSNFKPASRKRISPILKIILHIISILPLNYAGLIPCKGIRRQPSGSTTCITSGLYIHCILCDCPSLTALSKGSSSGFDIHSRHFMTSSSVKEGQL